MAISTNANNDGRIHRFGGSPNDRAVRCNRDSIIPGSNRINRRARRREGEQQLNATNARMIERRENGFRCEI